VNRRDYGNFEDPHVQSDFDSDFEDSRRRNTNVRRTPVNVTNKSTCQQLADIIGGMVIQTSPACTVMTNRNINATILGRRTQSPLALPFGLSFESNVGGRTLNLGETVILQKEINPFISALRRRGITVTAVHNHWLFDEPRLMYMHWEHIGDPFVFAENSLNAAKEVGLL
jgi:hypothetical protein